MPTASTARAFGRQAVEPLAGGDRLVGVRVVAEAAPVALVLDGLVRYRALDDQDEGVQLAPVGLEEPLEEVVGAADRTALEVDQRPVDGDLREPRQGAERDLLDARLCGTGQGDRVAVATEPGVDPEDVDDVFVRRSLGGVGHGFPPGREVLARAAPSTVLSRDPWAVNGCVCHLRGGFGDDAHPYLHVRMDPQAQHLRGFQAEVAHVEGGGSPARPCTGQSDGPRDRRSRSG